MSCWRKAKQFLLHYLLIWFVIGGYCATNSAQESTHFIFTSDIILHLLEKSCFVAFDAIDPNLSSVFADIEKAFKTEENVTIGHADLSDDLLSLKSDRRIKIRNPAYPKNNTDSGIVVFPRHKIDRSCLLTSGLRQPGAVGDVYTGSLTVFSVLNFINVNCNSYRRRDGYLTVAGLHREEILRSLFHVENVRSIGMKDIPFHCSKGLCHQNNDLHHHKSLYQEKSDKNQMKSSAETSIHKCDKINIPSNTNFFNNYLKLSKPVIIRNAMENWPAIKKWSNEYFRTNFGKKRVHIKLTPQGVFEGVDFATEFENYETFQVPYDVRKQLKYPDLVVVRPALQNMNFSQFIDLMESIADGKTTGISAYLEYSSLSDIVEELEHDVIELPFMNGMLKLEHLNMWLSDGKTLGKLHFDPFDNLLCQISGKKEVLLFAPHDNTKLYEAHIPEAMLAYDNTTQRFVKKRLMDSTSMVMSPVDLSNPNYERFPKFAEAFPMNCTIEEGEVLFMPAFWWHEVQSYPSLVEKRNLAVNFWYDPFLTKEFPCEECKLDVNPNYRHLL